MKITVESGFSEYCYPTVFFDRLNKYFNTGIDASRIFSTSLSLRSVGILPARRSIILPSASSVQKLKRIATSSLVKSNPMPAASRAPRPIRNFCGSYPKIPRCPGPLPGVMPLLTVSMRPETPFAARASIFGVCAASSSVKPCLPGRPPRPSQHKQ